MADRQTPVAIGTSARNNNANLGKNNAVLKCFIAEHSSYRNTHRGLLDIQITHLVTYVREDRVVDPSLRACMRTSDGVIQLHGVKSVRATWPDGVSAVLIYPQRNSAPTKQQLVDAYRNATLGTPIFVEETPTSACVLTSSVEVVA